MTIYTQSPPGWTIEYRDHVLLHFPPGAAFALRQVVWVEQPDGERRGVVEGVEPGDGCYPPIEGWAFHVRLEAVGELMERVVVVSESLLTTTEDANGTD